MSYFFQKSNIFCFFNYSEPRVEKDYLMERRDVSIALIGMDG